MEFKNIAPSLRAIKTARSEKMINKAAKEGYWPLVKKVEPSKKIKTKYCIIQDEKTGEIEVLTDFRGGALLGEKAVIDWTFYYPYKFPSPYAAYLIPKDLAVGERVLIEDLIEDYVGSEWNQGDTFRLDSCEAIWNGKDFDIQFDPEYDQIKYVG